MMNGKINKKITGKNQLNYKVKNLILIAWLYFNLPSLTQEMTKKKIIIFIFKIIFSFFQHCKYYLLMIQFLNG
jgi:hypothetical protein